MTTLEATPEITANMPAAEFDPMIHDGRITVENPATGGHRTFQIRTARKGALEGQRIVSLLTGPNTANFGGDWQGFGTLDGGVVRVWSKFRGQSGKPSDWEVFGRMLSDPLRFMARGMVYQVEGRCRRCNKVLTRPESLARGLGEECWGRAD